MSIIISRNGCVFASDRTPDAKIAPLLKKGTTVFVYDNQHKEWRMASLGKLGTVLRSPLPDPAFFAKNGLAVH